MVEDKITINTLYEEVLKNRNEIRSYIEASEVRLLLKIEELKLRLDSVEKENLTLQNRIEYLERTNKKNNIIIFGLIKDDEKITTTLIIQELNKLLELNLAETDINNLYRLGQFENSPVKVEFISYLKKIQVLKNCSKLKGTNISIVHDLTPQQRQDNQILKKHLKVAKQNRNNICYIKKNKLHINEEIYTLEQLREKENYEDFLMETKSSSAPATPITIKTKKQQEIPVTIPTEIVITETETKITTADKSSKKGTGCKTPIQVPLHQPKEKKKLRSNSVVMK